VYIDDPVTVHRLLSEAKAARLEAARATFGAQAASENQLYFDVEYYDLDLTLLIPIEEIAGKVLMRATSLKDGLSQFELDLHYLLTADSVYLDGVPVAFSHPDNVIYITSATAVDSGATFELLVYYHGPPKPGGFLSGGFGFASHGSPAVPMVWTLSEPFYAREWWPCKDTPSDKADSVDIHVTCPADLFASSNGLLVGDTDNGDGTRTYDWRHRYPITTYLVSIAVTNYVRLDYWYYYNDAADSMPVYFWVYPEHVAQAEAQYPEVLEMMDALGDYFGLYPFIKEKYAITQFEPAGMEHQTNTSNSATWYSWYLDEHELAHQWWGDMVTCESWQHIWLNEGIATWTEALVKEWQEGPEAYLPYMNTVRYTGSGTIFVDDTTSASRIFDGGLSYHKGAWVMHMLRGALGDDVLFPAMAEYRRLYTGKSASTEDLRDVLESVSGVDLHEFFADWIYGERFPRYQYSFLTVPEDGRYHVLIKIYQIQTSLPLIFDMPIEILLSSELLDTSIVVYNNRRGQVFDAYLPFAPLTVQLDPHDWILKSASQIDYGLAIISDTLAPAYQLYEYTDTLQALNGVAPFYWFAVDADELPYNLSVGVDGTVHGIPYVFPGTYTFEVRVYDSGESPSTRRDVTIVVLPPRDPPGDMTHDGSVRSDDLIWLVNYIYRDGPAPEPIFLGDVNLSCTIDLSDVVFLVDYIFRAGDPPTHGCAE